MHLSEGQLQAYYDDELGAVEIEQVRTHLAACDRCRSMADGLFTRTDLLLQRLPVLDPNSTEGAAPVQVARAKLKQYKTQKEKIPMFNKLFTRNTRPIWAALAVIAIVAIAFTLPQVQAVANSFLGLFRAQQVAVVPFNPLKLPENLSDAGPGIMQMFTDNMDVKELGKAQDVATAAEASALLGIPVRLPAELDGTPKLTVEPGMHVAFKVDLPRISTILKEAGFSSIHLPDQLDGTTVEADLPTSLVASYGECDSDKVTPAPGDDPDEDGVWNIKCTVLVQLPSPTVSTPDGLDIAAIGKAYLQMTGMTAEEADTFSQTVDWSTTLVIPVPTFTEHETLTVDGVQGVLIRQNSGYDKARYMLLWVKDGNLYALTGYGDSAAAQAIANSLK